eukprot:gene8909-9859_t
MFHVKTLKFLFFFSIVLILLSLAWINKIPTEARFKIKLTIPEYAENSQCKRKLSNSTKKPLASILLAINFNHPMYSVIPTLEAFYEPIFSKYVFCGPHEDYSGDYQVIRIKQSFYEYGHYGYECLVEAISRNPDFKGYLLVNDDMILNWWNFLELNTSRIWYGEQFPNISEGHKIGSIPNDWFERDNRGWKCSKFYLDMKTKSILKGTDMFETYERNTNRKGICIAQLSDLFYIPKRFASKFVKIAKQFYNRRMFLEVAVPMTLYSLEYKWNIVYLNGLYLQKKYGWGKKWKDRTEIAWMEYSLDLHFLHPYKFHGNDEAKNTREFKENVGKLSTQVLEEKCLDATKLKRNFSLSSYYEEE